MSEPARRTLLLGAAAAGLGLVGCTGERKEAAPTASSPRTISSSTSPSSPLPDPLPSASPWPFVRTEVEPQAKGAAVRLLEALGTWPRGQQGAAPATERAEAQDVAAGSAPDLVVQAQPLLDAGSEATVRVIAAQYGGLLSARASVLVALRQWGRAADGTVQDGGSTVDVRLTRTAASGWQVSDLYPSRTAQPLARPGTLIEQVVAHDRIRLPPAAEADVRAGQLRPKPLRALLTLAETYEIDVSVVHTGHPRNVFGTDRLSDHTRMRAFDVWAVDGHTVIDPATSDALIDGFMRAAAKAGAYNVGGPRQLGLPGFFSDRVHRDHLHIAFDSDT